jgi:DNA-binding transcriptional MerR regulator
MKRVKLYYSISEVAEITELQPYTLRSWEKEFSCLRPRRIHGKNRSYRERDIGIVFLIKRLLYDERYTTQGASKKLKSEPELLRNVEQETAFLHTSAEADDRDSRVTDSSIATDPSSPVADTASSPSDNVDGERTPVLSPGPISELLPADGPAQQPISAVPADAAFLRELIAGTRRELHELLQILR